MLNQSPTSADGAALDAAIEAKVRDSGSSFYWAMRLLSREKRAAMYAVYAFCREVDDVADGDASPADKRAQLDTWRGEVEAVYAGHPETDIGRRLNAYASQFDMAKQDFLAVIDGMEMDAVETLQLKDGAELALYCDRVACAVGRLSNAVFGLDKVTGDKLAKALGDALQLTNILRDVAEDAARAHVYLPGDLLAKHGLSGVPPVDMARSPAVEQVCLELAETAAEKYRESAQIMAACDRATVRPARIMMHVYRAIFNKLRRRGWKNPAQRVSISKARKLLAVISGYW